MSINSRLTTYDIYRKTGKTELGTAGSFVYSHSIELSISLLNSTRETNLNLIGEGLTHVGITESAEILINDEVRTDNCNYRVLYIAPAGKRNIVYLKAV
ncbi:MAG: hypothetical protein PHE63_00265 [Eubacteriales bacterium]|nr:hypothetical protein [Eubacteriales bacterium]